ARPQDVDEVVHFLLREIAGNLPAIADFRVDGRGGHDQAVEDDGQVAVRLGFLGAAAVGDVLAGDVAEQVGAFGVKRKVHGRPQVGPRTAGRTDQETAVDLFDTGFFGRIFGIEFWI